MQSTRRFSVVLALVLPAIVLGLCTFALAIEPTHGNFKTSDGVNIHYIEMGQGTPVIMIHGYTGSGEGTWLGNGVLAALAKNHRAIALDCRNHGKSDKPQPNGQGEAKDVVELMDHLKIPKAHVHGYSMGGGITQRLLTMIPDRMLSAGFGGSGIVETDPEWIAKLVPDKQGRDPLEDEALHKLRVRHGLANGMSLEEAEKSADAPREPRARPAAPAAGGAQAAGSAPAADRPRLDLTKLNIPMMVVNGEFDSPNRKSTRIAREVKNHKVLVLAGKSHNTAVSQGYIPKEYIESLVAFIDANDPK